MFEPDLEVRVAALEKRIASIEAGLANGSRTKDWRRTVGMFTGDEVMKRIFENALRYREADRRKARRKSGKRSAIKK